MVKIVCKNCRLGSAELFPPFLTPERCSNAPKIKNKVVHAEHLLQKSQTRQTAKTHCAGSIDALRETGSSCVQKIQMS